MHIAQVGNLMLGLSLLAGASGGPPAETRVQSFTLDSTVSTYPFTVRVEGTYELKDDTVLVRVTGGEIRSAIPRDLGDEGEATDIRIAFGLGGTVEAGWHMGLETPDQVIAQKLVPGESLAFHELQFVVTGVERALLPEQWLSVRLGVIQHLPGVPAGLLWSYACSEQNFLGPTAASRKRAKLMKSAYSHTC